MKLGSAERLRKDVSDHVGCRAIDDDGVAVLDSLPDEVESHINVLGTRVKCRVLRQRDGTLIVAKESGGGVGKE